MSQLTVREQMFCEYVAAFRDPEAAARACRYKEPALAAQTLMNRLAIIRYLRHLQSSKTVVSGFTGLTQLSRLAVESESDTVRLQAASKLVDIARVGEARYEPAFEDDSDELLEVEDEAPRPAQQLKRARQ